MVLYSSAESAAMFIRVKKIGQYEYLYLVENVREGVRLTTVYRRPMVSFLT